MGAQREWTYAEAAEMCKCGHERYLHGVRALGTGRCLVTPMTMPEPKCKCQRFRSTDPNPQQTDEEATP